MKRRYFQFKSILPLLSPVLLVLHGYSENVQITVSSDTSKKVDWGMLMSGNNCLWSKPERLEDAQTQDFLNNWKPALLRIPGGSWSDEFFWNGNGVREGERLDGSKFVNGLWEIDYTSYKPGFRVADVHGEFSDYHGSVDIKYLHEFAKTRGIGQMVTVNAGSGSARDAAEWVKWANKTNRYGVEYWEVGNELEGDWEVGHIRPSGKKMTGSDYAQIFIDYARAMKAEDPTIKVGGPVCSSAQLAYVETLIKEAGHLLDFVAFHTYPVEGQLGAQHRYNKASVKQPVTQIREWLQQYQPERAEEIEIGVTEWHVQVAETKETVDLTSGLWSVLFLKSLADEGVDFACQWDLYSSTATGGHGFFEEEAGHGARAQATVFELLRENLGSEMLASTGDTDTVRSLVTREGGQVNVILVNLSETEDATVLLDGITMPDHCSAQRYSALEYFWNDLQQNPEWSARATDLSVSTDAGITLPAQSILVLKPGVETNAAPLIKGVPQVELILADKVDYSFPTEGYVVVRDSKTGLPYEGSVKVKLQATNGELSADEVMVNQAVKAFTVSNASPHSSTITATLGESIAESEIHFFKPQERMVQVYDYETNPEQMIAQSFSSYSLQADSKAIPNSTLVSVVLENAEAKNMANTLIQPTSLELPFEKGSIRGITLVVGKSADFSAPKGAGITVALQSDLDHWIPLKRVLFEELDSPSHKDFERIELKLPIESKAHVDAMAKLYNVMLALDSSGPVNGKLYVQSLGFILGE